MSIVDYLHGLYLRNQADGAIAIWKITDLIASNKQKIIAEYALIHKAYAWK